MTIGPWTVLLYFAWYDLWIGAFYDRDRRRLYIGIPMVGVVVKSTAWEDMNDIVFSPGFPRKGADSKDYIYSDASRYLAGPKKR